MKDKQLGLHLYPEHEKVRAIPENHRALLSDFLDWLGSKYVVTTEEGGWTNPEHLMFEYYKVDKDEFSAEKDRMVEYLQQVNAQREDGK